MRGRGKELPRCLGASRQAVQQQHARELPPGALLLTPEPEQHPIHLLRLRAFSTRAAPIAKTLTSVLVHYLYRRHSKLPTTPPLNPPSYYSSLQPPPLPAHARAPTGRPSPALTLTARLTVHQLLRKLEDIRESGQIVARTSQ